MSSNKEWMYLRLTNGLLTNHLYRESMNLFDLHLVDQTVVTVITLDVHVIRRSARIKSLLRVTRQGFIFIKTVWSLIIVCGTFMVRQNHLYMGMRHYIM